MRKSLAVLVLCLCAGAAAASPRVSYVFVRGSHNIISGGNLCLNQAVAKRKIYGQDFLWFHTAGRRYLIRDAGTLERIDRLFDPERAFDPEAERVSQQLRPLEQRESELDHEIDALEDRDEDEAPLSAAEEQRLDSLRREMDNLRPQMRALERHEEEIDRKRDALEAEAERQMLPILAEAIRSGIATEVR
jgi:prefoldin subunit 5